jgi:hypothetical protein
MGELGDCSGNDVTCSDSNLCGIPIRSLVFFFHCSLYHIQGFMMAMWTDVTTGFNTEEETVNFGTRTASDDSNAVFEILTLATVQSQLEVCC